MEDKILNKEISKESPEVSNDLPHTTTKLNSTHTYHVLSGIDNTREKKKRPDVDSIFNHITKSSTTNIDRDVAESILIELINQ